MHTHRQFWPTPTSECIDHSRKLLPQWGIRPRAVWPSSKAPPSGAKRTIFQSCILWFVDLITDQMLLWTGLKNKVNSPRLSYAKLQKIQINLAWLNICGSLGPAGCCARYFSQSMTTDIFTQKRGLLYGCCIICWWGVAQTSQNISNYLPTF